MKKILYILGVVVVTLTSCVTKAEYPWGTPESEDATPWLVISPSKLRLGDDTEANLRVFSLGEEVTSESLLYIVDESGEVSDFTATSFEATKIGTYTFYATYGDLTSEKMTVRVVDELDALPEDTDASNTSFYNRVLMTDFTGTTCQYCPVVAAALHEFAYTDEAAKATVSASHSYTAVDPMYNSYVAALGLQKEVWTYPTMMYGLDASITHSNKATVALTIAEMQSYVNALWVESAAAGISATSYLDGTTIKLTIGVKAAVADNYSVNAFLLEDGISATQQGVTDELEQYEPNTHNHVIRTAIAESVSTLNFAGASLGAISVGQVKTLTTTIAIEDAWRIDNCSLLIYVSNASGVVNSVTCSIDADLPYQYND